MNSKLKIFMLGNKKKELKQKKTLAQFECVDAARAADFIIRVQDRLKRGEYSYVEFSAKSGTEMFFPYGLIYLSDIGTYVSNVIACCHRGDQDGLANMYKCVNRTPNLLFPCNNGTYKLYDSRTKDIAADLRAFNPDFEDIVNDLVRKCLANPDLSMKVAMDKIIDDLPTKHYCMSNK